MILFIKRIFELRTILWLVNNFLSDINSFIFSWSKELFFNKSLIYSKEETSLHFYWTPMNFWCWNFAKDEANFQIPVWNNKFNSIQNSPNFFIFSLDKMLLLITLMKLYKISLYWTITSILSGFYLILKKQYFPSRFEKETTSLVYHQFQKFINIWTLKFLAK